MTHTAETLATGLGIACAIVILLATLAMLDRLLDARARERRARGSVTHAIVEANAKRAFKAKHPRSPLTPTTEEQPPRGFGEAMRMLTLGPSSALPSIRTAVDEAAAAIRGNPDDGRSRYVFAASSADANYAVLLRVTLTPDGDDPRGKVNVVMLESVDLRPLEMWK